MTNKRNVNSNFGRYGTFHCSICGKLTRETGANIDGFCPTCYRISEYENSILDGRMTIDEVPEKYRAKVREQLEQH